MDDKFFREEVPHVYVSTTGQEYSYKDYAPINERKGGMQPLPAHEYPYTIKYKKNYRAWSSSPQ